MLRIFIGLAVTWALVGAARADDIELDCEHASATIELDLCADREYGAADAGLNAAYKRARAGLNAPAAALLADAQRAWIAFRDKQCNYVRTVSEGRGHNVAYFGCMTGLTKTRTRDLKEQADSRR
jgi:uncharacterized protein YecT (DUF1311 family)